MRAIAPTLGERVSRREIAASPEVWFALTGTFGIFAAATLIAAFVMPGIDQARMLAFSASLAFSGAALTRVNPKSQGSLHLHVALALTYLGPAAAIYAFAPQGSAGIASATFVGALAAVWLTDRRQIAAHLTVASAALLTPSLLGAVDTATVVGTAALLPAIWILAICCIFVLESAEDEGRELARMVRQDPLTGVGNRRLLHEQLSTELPRHRTLGRPLTLVSLDLNGFKALNDTMGHAAGDELLRLVATTLRAAVRRGDTVIRQGGDEFCVILPETAPREAARVVDGLRHALADIDDFGGGVSAGIGAASFPLDAGDADALLESADARLLLDKDQRRPARRLPVTPDRAPADDHHTTAPDTHPADPHASSGEPDSDAPILGRISRRELAGNRAVWLAAAAMYLIYGALGTAVCLWLPEVAGPAFPYVVAAGTGVGLVLLCTRPVPIGCARNHMVIACSYLVPLAILITCQPGGSVAAGCAIFIGPLAAVRLVDRRQIGAHLATASLLFLALIPSGLVDAATVVAILMLVVTMWVLGACVTLVLEAAEAQGAELERLVRHDPLTGAANRRMLHEFLVAKLAPEPARGGALTVITLDLNGFKALNDRAGHAAGDELLIAAAAALASVARPGDLVVRQGGDEFCLVLPGTPPGAAAGRVHAVHEALRRLDCNGAPLEAGVGIASFPADASEPAELLATADARLIDDKARGRVASARGRRHSAPQARTA